MVLHGILLNPVGGVYANASVRLVAVQTSAQVLQSVYSSFKTDAAGAYSFDCPIGRYRVQVSGLLGVRDIGIITVTSTTTFENINSLLMLEATVAPRDPLLDQMMVVAGEAADSAQSAADSAAHVEDLFGDLANASDATKGLALVGTARTKMASTVANTASAAFCATWVNVWEFISLITVKPTSDPATWDWTPAVAGAQAKAIALSAASYGGYGVEFPAGVYPVTRIYHYSGISLRGMGSRNTFITALPFNPANGKPYGMLELAPGAIQGAHITGLTFSGSNNAVYGSPVVNSVQWGFYCWAQYDAGNVQGGFWHSNLVDVAFWNFSNGIWSRGGYTFANSRRPNQWIVFDGVQCVVQDGGQPWLFTGQHGQIVVRGGHGEGISAATPKRALYSAKVTWDPDPSTTAMDGVNGESISDVAGVGNAIRAGHNINFCQGYSFQRARKGVWVVGPARNINADSCWFETLAEAAGVEGDGGLCLTNNHFANAGIGTTAGGAAGSGYIVSLGANSQMDWGLGNTVEGSFDHFISTASSGANECRGFNFLGSLRSAVNGVDILPTLPQKSPAMDANGMIDMSSHRFATVAPNADPSVKLSIITSNILPGHTMVLRAASGAVTIKNSAGGNIVTGTGRDMTIPVGGIATLLRIQPYVSGSEFLLLSVSTHYATSAPSDGFYYAQGHIVSNTVPGVNTPDHWVVTTAGLAGSTAIFGSSFVGGQIPFPSVQIPSSDPNTLDDYRESNWTPVLTFSTPGNLAVTYTAQTGQCTKVGRRVSLTMRLDLSSFTYTTASGTLTITGLPFAPAATSIGVVRFGGINKAGYTQVALQVAGAATSATLVASGMGAAPASVVAADVPSGGSVTLWASITYDV